MKCITSLTKSLTTKNILYLLEGSPRVADKTVCLITSVAIEAMSLMVSSLTEVDSTMSGIDTERSLLFFLSLSSFVLLLTSSTRICFLFLDSFLFFSSEIFCFLFLVLFDTTSFLLPSPPTWINLFLYLSFFIISLSLLLVVSCVFSAFKLFFLLSLGPFSTSSGVLSWNN